MKVIRSNQRLKLAQHRNDQEVGKENIKSGFDLTVGQAGPDWDRIICPHGGENHPALLYLDETHQV